MVFILYLDDNIVARDKCSDDCQYTGLLMYEIHLISKGLTDILEIEAFTDNSQYCYITYTTNNSKEDINKKLFIYGNEDTKPIEISNQHVNDLCDKIVDKLHTCSDEFIHYVGLINDYANNIIARYHSFADELNNENPFKGLTKRAN